MLIRGRFCRSRLGGREDCEEAEGLLGLRNEDYAEREDIELIERKML